MDKEQKPASTVQPVSDAMRLEEALDKIDGLESDLENAVETAFKRGATEWTRLNYPKHYARLSVQEPAPSPAAVVDESSLLAAMAKNICLELSWGEVSDFEGEPCQWRVHERNGNHNDREWRLKGVGETPLAALKAALSEASQNAGGEQPAPKAEQQLAEIEEMLGGQGDDDGPQILPDFEEGMSTVAKVEACLFRLEKWRDLIEVYDRRSAPNVVSGAVREALERIVSIAYNNYGRQDEKMADIEPIARKALAALSQEPSSSAEEES